MSLTSFYKDMPSGFPGDIINPQNALIESGQFDPAVGPVQPGIPVKVLATGYFSPLVAGDPITNIYALFGRCVPTMGTGLASTFNSNNINTSYIKQFLVFGYEKVLVVGTVMPVRGRQVYVRTGIGASAYPIGAFSATMLDATFTPAPNIIWAENDIDSQGVAAVRFTNPLIAGGETGIFAGPGIVITP